MQDVVFNFIALAVIDDFDVFVYEAMRSEAFKQLLDPEKLKELFVISFTTSSRALYADEGGEQAEGIEDEDGKPMCNKISFWYDRTCINKFYWLVYRISRFGFVVCYFYFYPMLLVFGNAFGSFLLAKVNQTDF